MERREGYFDSDLVSRLARLEITARRVVDGFLAGRNRSRRHGLSVEFVEHREYSPGDDLRHLDWKVLGRMDRYYVKRYEEETSISVLFLVDASASMRLGSGAMSKFELAACTAMTLAHLLHRQRDAVGVALFDTKIRAWAPPSAKRVALARLAASLEGAPSERKTELAAVVRAAIRDVRRRSLIVLLSDLFVPADEVVAALKLLDYEGHDAIVLQVLDAAERDFPFRTNVLFRGVEDGRELRVEPRRLRTRYLQALSEFLARVRGAAESCAFDYRLLTAGEPLEPVLSALLERRHRTRHVTRRRRHG